MPGNPVGDAVRKMKACADVIETGARPAVTKAANTAKKEILASMPFNRLSKVGKAGAKLNVSYDIRGSGSSCTANVRAKGPWQLIENGNRPHGIQPKGKGKKRKGALKTPYGLYVKVHHPGTKGMHLWAKGAAAAKNNVTTTMKEQYIKDVRKAFSS